MNIFIDLFSGLGGASYAFDEDPNWCTFKIDNNPELLDYNRGLHILDISDTDTVVRMIRNMIREIGMFFDGKLVIWASPPCQQFSYANANRKQGQTVDEFDMTLFDAALDIIEILEPDYWIIENVLGAVPIVEDEYSMLPTQQIGSIVMWGNFPPIAIRARDSFEHRKLSAKGSRSLRPNWRAKIPQSVSFGLLDSLTRQRSLKEWLPIAGIEE